MGSIETHDTYHPLQPTDSPSYRLSTGRVDEDDFRSYQVLDHGATQDNIPVSVTDEIVLLSWFITLLRTRENTNVSFNWAYYGPLNGHMDEQQVKCFTQDVLMTSIKDKVRAIAARIFSQLDIYAEKPGILRSCHASLILSTTSHTLDNVDEQVRQPRSLWLNR